MRHLPLAIIICTAILALPARAYPLFKPLVKSSYIGERYELRVNELIRVEFSKPQESNLSKKDLLLKRLRELLDKNSQTI